MSLSVYNPTLRLNTSNPGLTTPQIDGNWSGINNVTIAIANLLNIYDPNVATWLITPTSANLLAALQTKTGTGNVVFATSPTLVTPLLGTPASGVLTNCTGIASGLTAGTVTTNANLTGIVTSVGNTTSIAYSTISNAMLANAAVSNLSNVNSGDETTSTIKTKLGITTLSGSNTGDQTISITGDATASGSTGALTVAVTKLNGVALSGLATGLLKNTTSSGIPSIASQADILPLLGAGSITNAMLAGAPNTTTAPNALVLRDSEANISGNNFLASYATTASAGTTTTLGSGSSYWQYITGSTTQTVQMPATNTLMQGQSYCIINTSTGLVTINSSGGNVIGVLAAGTYASLVCLLTSGTTATSWGITYINAVAAPGKQLTCNNTLILAGTDGTTQTFPTTSQTIAGLASAQSWTKSQTGTPTALSVVSNAIAVDLSLANNFTLTLQATTSQILSNPTNAMQGTSGIIYITQNGASASILTYDTYWRESSTGTSPSMTTTLGKTAVLSYTVVSSTDVRFTLGTGGL